MRILRNAADLKGQAVHFEGVVGQTLTGEIEGVNYYLIFLSRRDYLYLSYVGDRFIREDSVEVWGEVLGLEIYQTGAGAQRTVPAIATADMKLIE